jgi:hypothetical protein
LIDPRQQCVWEMVRADWAIVTGWQKLLLGIALCLPIPALSVSGLALPLPSAVYRVAVAIVESTERLTGAFTSEDRDVRVLSIRKTTTPIRQEPAQPSRPGFRVEAAAAPARSAVRTPPAVRIRARSFDVAPERRTRPSHPAADVPVRTPSAPATEPKNAPADPPAVAAAPRSANTPEPAKERVSTVRPMDTVAVEPPTSRPSVSPPSPPPAPTPGLLDPVTKPLESVSKPLEPVIQPLEPVTKPLETVTKPLEPVTKPLAPVTDVVRPVTRPLEPLTGRLGILNP